MKREELQSWMAMFDQGIHDIKEYEVYDKSEADKVMDAYEAKIKELKMERDNAMQLEQEWKETSDNNHKAYVDYFHLCEKQSERIKELENKNRNLQYSSDMWMACCKLMSEGKRNVMSSDAIAEMKRIKELEAENARLKATISIMENNQKEK